MTNERASASELRRDLVKLAMQVAISLGLLGSGLFVLITSGWEENPQLNAAAAGWIGVVVGYWLK